MFCPEYVEIAWLVAFFAPLALWTLVPANDRVLEGERVYCAANDVGQSVVYAANGGTVRLSLPMRKHRVTAWDLASGTVREWQIDAGSNELTFAQGTDAAALVEPDA